MENFVRSQSNYPCLLSVRCFKFISLQLTSPLAVFNICYYLLFYRKYSLNLCFLFRVLTNISNRSHASKPLANGCKFFADFLVFDFKLHINNPQSSAQVSKVMMLR